jgi:hypothetical protein
VTGIEDRNVYNNRRDSNTVSQIGRLQEMATCYRKRSLCGTRSHFGLLLSIHFSWKGKIFDMIQSYIPAE